MITLSRPRVLTALAGACLLSSGGLFLAGPLQAAVWADTQAASPEAVVVTYRPGALALDLHDADGAEVPSTTAILVDGTGDLAVDTDLLPVGLLPDDQVTVGLTGADGPGQVTLGTPDGAAASSTDLARAAVTVPVGTRTALEWQFTEPGDYQVTMTVAATAATAQPLEPGQITVLLRVSEPAPGETPTSAASTSPAPRPGPGPSTGTAVETLPPDPAQPPARPAAPRTVEPPVPERAGPPDGPLPAPDTSLLTDATRDGVDLTADTVPPGTLLTVQLSPGRSGQWVSPWILSTPTDLGWKQVDSDGTITVALSEELETGAHRLVVRDTAADLVGWSPLKVEEDASAQCIPTTITETLSAADADIVTEGHFDLGPVVEGSTMRALAKDDRTQPAQWVDPATLVFHLGDTAAVQSPGGEFDFLGSGTVWQVPLTQATGVPWIGWNTQHQTVAGKTDGTITLTLNDVEGPGQLAVYSMGSFGNLGDKYFGTVDGFGRSTSVPVGASGVHVHAIWAFTQPGVYHVTITFSGTVEGQQRTASSTLNFFVGPGDAAAAARPVTVERTVGRTADGEECELPAGTGGTTSGGPGLAETGLDRANILDLTSLAVTFLLVGLAFLRLAALSSRRLHQPSAATRDGGNQQTA